ncbi:MAG: helix-turn-helix domain-containing protein [Pseudomonadota bacterium]
MSVGIQQRFDKNSAHLAVSLVAYTLEIRAEEILQPERGPRELVRARQVAMYLTHVGLGMSLSRVAIAFERDRSTVAHACHRIEEMRDDPAYDTWLEALELGIATVAPLLARAA